MTTKRAAAKPTRGQAKINKTKPGKNKSHLTHFTPKKRECFLETLRSTANVSKSAQAILMSRQAMYNLKKNDTAFSQEWDDAMDQASDALESEARRRAYEGVKKPVFQGGKRVGYVQEYSDTLLIFLLKGAKPEKYKDRHEHSGPGGGAIPISVSNALDKFYGDSNPES